MFGEARGQFPGFAAKIVGDWLVMLRDGLIDGVESGL